MPAGINLLIQLMRFSGFRPGGGKAAVYRISPLCPKREEGRSGFICDLFENSTAKNQKLAAETAPAG
jgi:hypothetical protein